MKIYKASLETSNFTFEAYGDTPGAALDAMRRGWIQHRKDYQATDTWADVEEDVRVGDVQIGKCYRDGESEPL